jgi:starvation-inducible DNA-binding protein
VGHASRLQRLEDDDADFVTPEDIMAGNDTKQLVAMRETPELCDEYNDVVTASLPENWIDQTERRH